uniref:High-affinity nickel-transporter n=1 Tax=Solibacter usitatus (strain Ellin6076) TaxID=234267 RepID=Q025F9_SOLUE
MTKRLPLLAALCAALAAGHPMGNFSVNHYARFEPSARGLAIRYVMDLAEIPTFELFQQWGPGADPKAKALDQAREWAAHLAITVAGKPVKARVEHAAIVLAEGAGNMQVARITADLIVDAAGGRVAFEDRNYEGRSGWKEIVRPGAADRSAGLTAYPSDPMLAPPQDVKTSFLWTVAPASPRVETPVAAPPPPPPPGTVVKGDYLSTLLRRSEIGWQLTLIGIAVAFGLGAMHAMSPGHGKTIVAAYLVGSRGTFKHAIFLGGMVTFTHTASVFALGFVTLFLSRYVLPETLFPILGAISGLSIVWVGAMLFFRRLHRHGHDHHHHHGDGHTHSHSHVPEGEITMGSLIALGASGGLVPCPSALVLLLSAISLGRVGLGMLLLVGFSAGLATVLMGMGVLVLCVGNLLPATQKFTATRAFRLLPAASAALITCVGLVMTCVSLGIIRPFAIG